MKENGGSPTALALGRLLVWLPMAGQAAVPVPGAATGLSSESPALWFSPSPCLPNMEPGRTSGMKP